VLAPGLSGDTEPLWPAWISKPIPLNFTGWKKIYVPTADFTFRAPLGVDSSAPEPKFSAADTVGFETNRRAGTLIFDDLAWGDGVVIVDNFEAGVGAWRTHGSPDALQTGRIWSATGIAHQGAKSMKLDFSGYAKKVDASLAYLKAQADATANPYVLFIQQSVFEPVNADALPQPGDAADSISTSACADQITPVSFTLYAKQTLSNVVVSLKTPLKSAKKTIPASAVDIRVVKWLKQHGIGSLIDPDSTGSVQGVLVKDDSAPLTIDSSGSLPDARLTGNPTTNIPAFTQKQFWVNISVPRNTPAGSYTGQILVSGDQLQPITIPISLNILPINLYSSSKQYLIRFRGRLDDGSQPSTTNVTERLSEPLYNAELKDILAHGVRWVTLSGKGDQLWKEIDDYNAVGLAQPYLYRGFGSLADAEAVDQDRAARKIDSFLYLDDLSASLGADAAELKTHHMQIAGTPITEDDTNGVEEVIYPVDNPYVLNAIKAKGNRTSSRRDWITWSSTQNDARLNRIYSGLYLWEANLYGALLSDYQSSQTANPYDDSIVSTGALRSQMLAYPTNDGLLDTIGWEAIREGITDTRYLTSFYTVMRRCKDAKIQKEYVNKAEATVEGFLAKPLLGRSDAEIQAERQIIANFTIKMNSFLPSSLKAGE